MSIPPVRPRDNRGGNERDYDPRDHRRTASRNEMISSPIDQRDRRVGGGGGTISRSGGSDMNIKQDDWSVDESASKFCQSNLIVCLLSNFIDIILSIL